jgi:alkanesulfonate monooxygenase SsuD/methylene tetrahydromethanopterin reductase-like flavin-dependent oxidoreductase (luciferase family)
MRYGFVLPYGDARTVADYAAAAEGAGWDGFFVWEPVWGIDAWVALTAAAMQTSSIRLGTMLSPISRMRPWKLASEAATLDNLSHGRIILTVGLGATQSGFAEFGEETDRKIRAELLDEGLAIITGLWKGQPFSYSGKHYQVQEFDHFPPPSPVQQPRIPIWVVGAWPRPKSLARALQYDGILPTKQDEQGEWTALTPDDVRAIRSYIAERRPDATEFDIIIEGETPGDDPARATDMVRPWIEAGATWWIEGLWDALDQPEQRHRVLPRIRQGPPRNQVDSTK